MVELVTNLEKISSLINVDAKKKFTSVAVGYDSYKAMGPKIARCGEKIYLFACYLEKGNIQAQKEIERTMPSDIEAVYYAPFFTFENEDLYVYPDFISAFETIAKRNCDMCNVLLEKEIPVSMYKLFSEKYHVCFQAGEVENSEYYLCVLSKKEILEKFNFQRDRASAIAINLTIDSPHRSDFEELICSRSDSRFETLDFFMEKEKLDAVFCTSPLSIQETTGYGLRNYRENQLVSLYTGGEEVFLFSKSPLGEDFRAVRKADLFSLIAEHVNENGALGIEGDHCPTYLFEGLENITKNIKDCMVALRKSREIRGWQDLSYYIIASRGTVYAIENALEWAKGKISQKEIVSELDVENKYENFMRVFIEKHDIPFNIIPMLTICSAGSRNPIPSLPTKYLLDTDAKSLKLDAGVSICDMLGIHHAASDITRTLVLQKDIRQTYEKLETFMLEKVIPNIKPQMTGKEIYHLAVSQIEDHKDFFKKAGLLSPEVQDFESVFNRNVGHLMGLQEPVTLFFLKNADERIETGMIAAIEYQWHTKGFGIGIEDNFVVGASGGLNYSRD